MEVRMTVSHVTGSRLTHQALRESEERLRAICWNSSDAILFSSPDGTVYAANPEACRIFGMTEQEICEAGRDGLVDTSDPRLQQALDERSRTGKYRGELTFKRKDGTRFPGEISSSAYKDKEGHDKTTIVIRDIAKHKRIEEALQASEGHFRALAEDTSDWVWEVDEQLRYTYASPKVTELLGYTPTEMLGKTPFDFMPPEEALRVRLGMDEFTKNPRPIQALENVNVRKDGSLRVLETSGVPLFDAAGRLAGFRGIDRDITERKRAEEERTRLSAIVESSNDAIIGKSEEGMITSWNPAAERMYGYAAAEVIGKPFSILVSPELVDEIPQVLERIKRVEHVETFETMRRRKDGTEICVSLTVSPIRDSAGNIKGVSTIARDMTAHQEAQEKIEKLNADLLCRATELETANRELEAFNYTVSHDLRAPLTNISLSCQVIMELWADSLDAECKRIVRQINGATEQMEQLIRSLLNFSRIAHVQMKREATNLSEMAMVIASEFLLKEPDRHVALTIAEGLTVYGDPGLLRVVLTNLLENAWKYTAKKETAVIEFGVTERDGEKAYFVSDNGAGFDMSQADRLFAAFQRLDGTKQFAGHGIGLATVRRIVQRHGGKVWAEGEVGKGAAFYFTLGN